METIDALERKLHATRQQACNAKYPTGLIVDLTGPEGNIFYLMGVCNRLVRELRLSPDERQEFETELNTAGDYQSRLAVMQKWFGIVFTGLAD